jgi:hypothetical protein
MMTMAFCSSCGAPMPDGAAFCGRCGARVGAAPGGLSAPPMPSPVAGPRRPTGWTMEPWLVILFVIISFGIYGIFFWWRAARETDAFRGTPGHALSRVKMGLAFAVAGVAAFILGFVFLASSAASQPGFPATDNPFQDVPPQSIALFVLLFFAGMGLALAGGIIILTGAWRVWTTIEQDERARNVVSPLSPGLMLAFLLIPYVNVVTTWIMYYRTQKGLNGMWAAEQARPVSYQTSGL